MKTSRNRSTNQKPQRWVILKWGLAVDGQGASGSNQSSCQEGNRGRSILRHCVRGLQEQTLRQGNKGHAYLRCVPERLSQDLHRPDLDLTCRTRVGRKPQGSVRTGYLVDSAQAYQEAVLPPSVVRSLAVLPQKLQILVGDFKPAR
jgi:hypothetical protein